MSSRFVFNTGQRIGILGLILMILVLSGVIYGVKHRSVNKWKMPSNQKKEEGVQYFIDSLKALKTTPKTYKIYPFNPNFITDYKGYRLGLSPEEIDRLHRFRAQDKWINSTRQFQAVTKVSDSLLEAISPYFKFPDWVIAKRKRNRKRQRQKERELPDAEKADLNTATAAELQKIKGIGKVLSHRIVRYRAHIGGFAGNIQLKDVYGLTYQRRQHILAQFTVKHRDSLQKIDLNKATTAQLTQVPYFDYELARKIVNYRITHEGISSFEELTHIERFPFGRIDRLQLYLKISKNP